MNTLRTSLRPPSPQTIPRPAFTLLELLVVIGVLALLASIAIPALSRSQPASRTAQCLNNNRQLAHAWRMYADDSRDQIVYASDDGNGSSNPLNQYAWTQAHVDFNPNNRANWDTTYLTNAPLWPYCHGSISIYRCPSDHSSVVFANGTRRPRLRTMAMNLYLGGFAGTDGGWAFIHPYRIFVKTTDLSLPGPSKTFVFLDQHPDVANWGNFLTDMTGYSPRNPAGYNLYDLPGYFHDGGCTFSFADNHAELKHWADPRTIPPLYSSIPGNLSPNNPDVAWLQDHATGIK